MVLDELKEVKGVDIAVRVNSVGSQLLEEDLRVILTAENRPSTVLLPKTDTVKDIVQVIMSFIYFLSLLLLRQHSLEVCTTAKQKVTNLNLG